MLVLAILAGFAVADATPQLAIDVDNKTAQYTIFVDGAPWLASPAIPPTVCINGNVSVPLVLKIIRPASGKDALGTWTGLEAVFEAAPATRVVFTFAARGSFVVLTAGFPDGLDTRACGTNVQLSTRFPAFDSAAHMAPSLNYVSWRDTALGTTLATRGLSGMARKPGLDLGPIIGSEFDGRAGATSVMWSTLDRHKIVVQSTDADGVYAMGVSAAVPSLPKGWTYSVLLTASYGGFTAASYAWGDIIRTYYGTTRLPSVTLTDVGYYTDDGAYYYVWEAFGCCDPTTHQPRPWAAEQGLVLVKEDLWAKGVPIAYMQLDDWWYTGPFYFGNVKAIVDWHPSNTSRLFPSSSDGTLAAFQRALGLPLQLYSPFWSDQFDPELKYNMTESTVFKGTKLVTPKDSYRFFSDWFDLGAKLSGGAKNFAAFEIDFLDSNFEGSASMFESTDAADMWYEGLARAALERSVAIQYCLPSATDMLQSLAYPAVVQARASGDYVNVVENPYQLGGSSLLMGATLMAPSKDTLWTASPQPPTYSDTIENGDYTTQPHVELDVVLATLSLGPVGISDGIGQVGVGLISQSFISASNSTLLRPARPLSWVDSFFFNTSFNLSANDVRSTHSLVPLEQAADATARSQPVQQFLTTHYVVAWRTATATTLAAGDLFPQPSAKASLVMRAHRMSPTDFQAGCEPGQPALGACVTAVPDTGAVIPATGTGLGDFSFWVVYEPLSNGAYFLGELSKLTHVSPQRFGSVRVDPSFGGQAGLKVSVHGTAGQKVVLSAIDPKGFTRVTEVTMPSSGFAVVAI